MEKISIADCLRMAQQLASVSESPRLDLEVFLAAVLQRDRTYLYTWPEKHLEQDQLQQFLVMLERRRQGEPVAYIVGEREFWSLSLLVNSSTLIPRPDTEVLVEVVLERVAPSITILDLGTGSGAIALALATELPQSQVHAVDFSARAVALAEQNRERLRLSNVRVYHSHWFGAVDGVFDVIVSNPPYIDGDDSHLLEGDVRFEPRSALVAANNGLADINAIILGASAHLIASGMLAFEHGWQQGPAVRQLFADNGYTKVETLKDYAGNERVTLGFAPAC